MWRPTKGFWYHCRIKNEKSFYHQINRVALSPSSAKGLLVSRLLLPKKLQYFLWYMRCNNSGRGQNRTLLHISFFELGWVYHMAGNVWNDDTIRFPIVQFWRICAYLYEKHVLGSTWFQLTCFCLSRPVCLYWNCTSLHWHLSSGFIYLRNIWIKQKIKPIASREGGLWKQIQEKGISWGYIAFAFKSLFPWE